MPTIHIRVAVLFLILSLWSSAAAQELAQDLEVIKVDTTLVAVNVTVTDQKHRNLAGLTIENFQVSEQGRPVKIEFCDRQGPASIVLVIDTSASMHGGKWEQLRAGLKKFLARARKDNDYSLVLFDDQARVVAESVSPDELRQYLHKPDRKGRTALYDGVQLGLKVMARVPKRHKAMVLLSDGEDNKSVATFTDVEQDVLAGRATIYAVGIIPKERKLFKNEERGKEILNQLAQISGGLAHFPGEYNIGSTLERIEKDLSNHYTLGYYAADKTPGWRRIEVKVSQQHAHLRYQESYLIR